MSQASYKVFAATWGNGEVMVELEVSKDQWDRIARGDRVEFKGRGYWYDGDWFQDIWDFNCPHGELTIRYGQPNDGDFSGEGCTGPISSVVVEGR
ncbi:MULTISPECIES: hypothetical protein [Bradyrhizobium]|uniref:Uncharacterized protein n=1 Tax=Bradyrhizobium arachidis TaxID=858423 RepID=A0AAE7NXN2_9BRAD|nr:MULTISPECIES: hypothetical protein [Bradyrhizobium]QOG18173.1 hypothetical protein FOM02_13250 [Bradyrhizobium sp. SEMIA]QOZ72080.1 hypothetical protein WN72_41695 [Bradyrhizobium arachidis]UFW48419.1 hypothetical protein BaraCB756_40205 [Bradyrhizobium arachidis]SFU85899.1 hypothetical protein SAMN05192541_10670 [Bradyrhizobium arachidis]